MSQTQYPIYKTKPSEVKIGHKEISIFHSDTNNVDLNVVKSFGEEWEKFHEFGEDDISRIAAEYFDIIPEELYNNTTRMLDVGCGSGRWTKILSRKVGKVDAVDPSDAIYAADVLLRDSPNVRLTKATSESLPFEDNTYELVISIGVLHHIPDTLQAMKDCVSKVKPGGYFYTYLYYKLENRGALFKSIFYLSDLLRKVVCRLPGNLKKVTCDFLAIFLYLPFILLSKAFNKLGLKKLSDKTPLSIYRNKSFFIIRNDALDRFGTKLEQRFTRQEIHEMLSSCGLTEIIFSNSAPYWHAIARKV